MNALNSIIVEGTISEVNLNENNIIFNIDCPRCYKDKDGNNVDEVSTFKILSFPSKQQERFFTVGRGIRVVGRLKQNKWYDEKWHSEIIIVAEHIEFKPMINN